MLWTPRSPPDSHWRARMFQGKTRRPERLEREGSGGEVKEASQEASSGNQARKYGGLTGSDEYPAGVAVPGSESGHALQVRRGAEDSCFQTGEPLALQEIETRPVDGR